MREFSVSPNRRRPLRTAALALALAQFTASTAHATAWFVQSGGQQLAFQPQTLQIQAGDTVTFLNIGGFHNVVADDGSFRCARGCDATGGNGNPTSTLWIATVNFPNPGRYGYFCEPHGAPGAGMFGTIIVAAPAPPPPPPEVPIDPSGGWRFAGALIGLLGAVAALGLRKRPGSM